MGSEAIPEVTDATFRSEVLEASLPVLVDFWAPWCRPCLTVVPILEALRSDREGELEIVKLDIDENPETPARYRVSSVPTFLLFDKGEVVERMLGAVPRSAFDELLRSTRRRSRPS